MLEETTGIGIMAIVITACIMLPLIWMRVFNEVHEFVVMLIFVVIYFIIAGILYLLILA